MEVRLLAPGLFCNQRFSQASSILNICLIISGMIMASDFSFCSNLWHSSIIYLAMMTQRARRTGNKMKSPFQKQIVEKSKGFLVTHIYYYR